MFVDFRKSAGVTPSRPVLRKLVLRHGEGLLESEAMDLGPAFVELLKSHILAQHGNFTVTFDSRFVERFFESQVGAGLTLLGLFGMSPKMTLLSKKRVCVCAWVWVWVWGFFCCAGDP